MLLASNLGREFYEKVRQHFGHDIQISLYGAVEEPEDVAIECLTCGEVLLDAERPIRWILTSDGLAKKVRWEDWSWAEDEDQDYPRAIQTEDMMWYGDEDIAYYSVSHEPTEDEFMEAYGIDAGRAAYNDFLTCPTCHGKGCGNCLPDEDWRKDTGE